MRRGGYVFLGTAAAALAIRLRTWLLRDPAVDALALASGTPDEGSQFTHDLIGDLSLDYLAVVRTLLDPRRGDFTQP